MNRREEGGREREAGDTDGKITGTGLLGEREVGQNDRLNGVGCGTIRSAGEDRAEPRPPDGGSASGGDGETSILL